MGAVVDLGLEAGVCVVDVWEKDGMEATNRNAAVQTSSFVTRILRKTSESVSERIS